MPVFSLKIRTLILLVLACSFSVASGQGVPMKSDPDSLLFHETIVLDGDTLPLMQTAEVPISGAKKERSRAFQRKYERLKPKVIKVYPYAQVAALLLSYYEERLQDMDMEVRQKAYMKKVENELKKEFKDEIKDLTVSEGRVLMKLIDRETGNTSFKIIEELRGNVAAFFWQSVARVFGSDLKTRYDPIDEDRVVEAILLDIKRGELEIPEREPKSEKVEELLRDYEQRGRWWKLEG